MRKTHKKILGFLSLGFVVAMTIFAATLPIPGAKATSSFTDTITVTVVGKQLAVLITNPEDGSTLTNPEQSISVEYQHADSLELYGKYTDENGVDHDFTIGTYSFPGGDATGDKAVSRNLGTNYGRYLLTAKGENNTMELENSIVFKYVPVDIKTDPDPTSDKLDVDLDYDFDNVCSVDLNIYNGTTLVTPPSPIHVEAPTTHVTISLAKLDAGEYDIVATGYNCDPDPQPLPFPGTVPFIYDGEDVPVPDTGSFFMGMNISKTDYLVTAIIMFFAFAVLALWIVVKGRRNNKRR